MQECEKKYYYFDYLEKKLSETQRREFEEHISQCPACSKNIYFLQEFLRHIEEAKRIKAPEDTVEKIWLRVEKSKQADIRYRHWQPALIGLAAMVAIVLGLLVGNYFSKNLSNSNQYSLYLNDTQQEVIELSLLE